ncbi:MAG TPA: TIGR00730 family Rossman fold protein [Parafilimonas sp.]|nr:TIGR00730 family Rossman fold protein [Parafilimonas sp.]
MWKSVAVFCGSHLGNNKLFAQHAEEIGLILAHKNVQLIYGGGTNGLMGIVANTVLKNKGNVTGVIPSLLNEKESQHSLLTTLHIVEDMHTRKKMMYELSDAAIILPGGYGTMDELFEMITWNQLNIHNKKIVLLNSDNYYDSLLAHFDKMHAENFLHHHWKESLVIIQDPQALVFLLDEDTHQTPRE